MAVAMSPDGVLIIGIVVGLIVGLLLVIALRKGS